MMGFRPIIIKSNGPLGRGMGAPGSKTISSFMMSEKENPWSEDETDTGKTTEANEPIEVDDDVSHEANENKEQGKFQSQ
jgi:hypothetical protein